jgi:hypothetical protein
MKRAITRINPLKTIMKNMTRRIVVLSQYVSRRHSWKDPSTMKPMDNISEHDTS